MNQHTMVYIRTKNNQYPLLTKNTPNKKIEYKKGDNPQEM